jgi:hypothetical protein
MDVTHAELVEMQHDPLVEAARTIKVDISPFVDRSTAMLFPDSTIRSAYAAFVALGRRDVLFTGPGGVPVGTMGRQLFFPGAMHARAKLAASRQTRTKGGGVEMRYAGAPILPPTWRGSATGSIDDTEP